MTLRGCARAAAAAIAALLVTAWLGYCGLFWWLQDGFVYQVPDWATAETLHAAAVERGVTELALTSRDGTRLLGWHQADGHDRVVLFLSGNGEALSDYLAFHDLVRAVGFDLVTVAWRGYPGSEGVPTQDGLVDDGQAAWDFLRAQGVPADRIVLHGRSLGGGVAMQLVGRGVRPGALVLESTFGRLRWVLASWAPGLPYPLLLRSPFGSMDVAPTVSVPTLVLASRGDALIPPESGGRPLSRAIPGAVYVEVDALTHQDDLPVSSIDARKAWEEFADRHVPRDEG